MLVPALVRCTAGILPHKTYKSKIHVIVLPLIIAKRVCGSACMLRCIACCFRVWGSAAFTCHIHGIVNIIVGLAAFGDVRAL